TTIWFRADSAGYYSGQCAEFCGLQHARMAFHVAATTPEEFDSYITGLRATGTPAPAPAATDSAPAAASAALRTTTLAAQAQADTAADSAAATETVAPASVSAGAELFRTRGCIACHTLDATSKARMTGPNLANVGSRRYIAAGTLLNSEENMARWIQDPQKIKPGVLMTPMGLTLEQSRSVSAYLHTLKKRTGAPSRAPRRSRVRRSLSGTGHYGNLRSQPRRARFGDPCREDRHLELDHDGRSQADRHHVRRVGLSLLPDRRDRGAAAPDPAGLAREHLPLGRDVQPAVHDARHHHDLPRDHAAQCHVLQLLHSAAAGR